MWRISLAFLALCTLGLFSAWADNEGGASITVGGQIPATCVFKSAPQVLNSANMNLSGAGTSSGQISIEELVDSDTSYLQPASIELEIAGVCNTAHAVSLTTQNGGLAPQTQQDRLSGVFINHVNYKAEVDWAGRSVVLETDKTPGKSSNTGVVEGPYAGPLTLNITIDGALNNMSIPVEATTYKDSLTLYVGFAL